VENLELRSAAMRKAHATDDQADRSGSIVKLSWEVFHGTTEMAMLGKVSIGMIEAALAAA